MFKSTVLGALCLWCASMAWAQDANTEFSVGKQEYLTSCSACHGETADGNGPISTMFKTRVPDLRKIAANNDGVFPLLKVIQVIDGRAVVRGHGNPMPLFGRRFSAEAEDPAMMGAEAITRGRVLELALYIQSIQE
jgi:mono/diheme cytochrome c family protein